MFCKIGNFTGKQRGPKKLTLIETYIMYTVYACVYVLQMHYEYNIEPFILTKCQYIFLNGGWEISLQGNLLFVISKSNERKCCQFYLWTKLRISSMLNVITTLVPSSFIVYLPIILIWYTFGNVVGISLIKLGNLLGSKWISIRIIPTFHSCFCMG